MTCPSCARVHPGKPCLRGVVLVCGGRDYNEPNEVWRALDAMNARMVIDAIRHGACGCDRRMDPMRIKGADRWAHWWAHDRRVPVEPMPADWSQGRRAGILRNQAMIDRGGVVAVVAFPGGSGTADMTRRARRAEIPVWLVAPERRDG